MENKKDVRENQRQAFIMVDQLSLEQLYRRLADTFDEIAIDADESASSDLRFSR